jgi:hypothetical protein
MSNKNKALTALKRKKFKTGGSTSTSEKRTGPSDVVDLDNPNKDYFKTQGQTSLQAPKADIEKAPAFGYDEEYITEDDEIKKIASPTDVTADTVSATFGSTSTGSLSKGKVAEYGVPQGYSLTPPNAGAASYYPNVLPDEGKVYAYDKNTGQRIQIDDPKKSPAYTASKVGEMSKTIAANSKVSTKAEAGEASLTERAKAPDRDAAEEQEAMSIPAADRPEYKEYATAARDDTKNVVEDVEGPAVERREGITITDQERDELRKIAQGRGVALEDLQEYQDLVTTKQRQVQQGTAAQKGYTPRLGETPEATAARAETYGADYTPQGGKTEIDAIPAYAKAATREAQVGVAAERIASELGNGTFSRL